MRRKILRVTDMNALVGRLEANGWDEDYPPSELCWHFSKKGDWRADLNWMWKTLTIYRVGHW